MLCNTWSQAWCSVITSLGGVGGERGSRGRESYMIMADSHCCTMETNTTYKAVVFCVLSHPGIPTLHDSVDCSPPGSSVHGDFLGKSTGVGCHALLQGLPNPGIEPRCPALQADSSLSEPPIILQLKDKFKNRFLFFPSSLSSSYVPSISLLSSYPPVFLSFFFLFPGFLGVTSISV